MTPEQSASGEANSGAASGPEDWRLWGDYTRGQEPRHNAHLRSLWQHGFDAGVASAAPSDAPSLPEGAE